MPVRTAFLLAAILFLPAHAEEARTFAPGEVQELLGRPVRIEAPDKPPQEIGRLVEVLVDAAGQPMAAVLDIGGFLGVGSRKVAVAWDALRFSTVHDGTATKEGAAAKDGIAVTLTLPADRIRAAPDYKGAGKPVQAVGP